MEECLHHVDDVHLDNVPILLVEGYWDSIRTRGLQKAQLVDCCFDLFILNWLVQYVALLWCEGGNWDVKELILNILYWQGLGI